MPKSNVQHIQIVHERNGRRNGSTERVICHEAIQKIRIQGQLDNRKLFVNHTFPSFSGDFQWLKESFHSRNYRTNLCQKTQLLGVREENRQSIQVREASKAQDGRWDDPRE